MTCRSQNKMSAAFEYVDFTIGFDHTFHLYIIYNIIAETLSPPKY